MIKIWDSVYTLNWNSGCFFQPYNHNLEFLVFQPWLRHVSCPPLSCTNTLRLPSSELLPGSRNEPTFFNQKKNGPSLTTKLVTPSQDGSLSMLIHFSRFQSFPEVSVICCCKLNKTRDCDEHLFGQVNTCTGRYQLPIFRCTFVHQWSYARPYLCPWLCFIHRDTSYNKPVLVLLRDHYVWSSHIS